MELIEILRRGVADGATDILISANNAPYYRILGTLKAISTQRISADETKRLLYGILNHDQIKKFESDGELDMNYEIKGLSRFRVNLYKQRNSVASAFRIIGFRPPLPEEIMLPKSILKISEQPWGLILVTGSAGSGKSTTCAALVEHLNHSRSLHIITLEDPIEFIFENDKCVIDQRQMRQDSLSYANALRAILRQDPDVIMVGEMRDLETIAATLTLAETGHLVIANLHTINAPQTLSRVVDVFPAYQQQQVAVQLAGVLKLVVSQQLVPRSEGSGLVAAREIMFVTPAIANLIRQNDVHLIYNAMVTSGIPEMRTMDQALIEIYKQGAISIDTVLSKAFDVEAVQSQLDRMVGLYV
ncbi:MAG: PilT/PilU family type 4a pilus ATPase [Candidatus Eremiobacteraeota bacterium]|nr:PilT/PilU family type 4a pilus ATPase [Candidatus Eremiobacteraeota bacterium]